MTARRTYPRPKDHHDRKAAEVLRGATAAIGWTPALPVPVERIIEHQFDLKIVWERLSEPEGQAILGALDPKHRAIYLNERHLELFENVIGPEAFTLAHELGHWLYDAENPDQLELFDAKVERVLCRSPKAEHVSDGERIREVNANGFAAALLLPHDLVRSELTSRFSTWASFAAAAARWGVSQETLRIRLQELALGWALP